MSLSQVYSEGVTIEQLEKKGGICWSLFGPCLVPTEIKKGLAEAKPLICMVATPGFEPGTPSL